MSADEKKSRKDEPMVTRRRMLKTLGITAGTVAASAVIPGKWIKPIVDVGVLPAHAQMSPACQYSILLEVFETGTNNLIPSGGDVPVQNIDIRATVTPNPGPASLVNFSIVWTDPGEGMSNPADNTIGGVAEATNLPFGSTFGDVDSVFTINATFDCATSNTWTGTVVSP